MMIWKMSHDYGVTVSSLVNKWWCVTRSFQSHGFIFSFWELEYLQRKWYCSNHRKVGKFNKNKKERLNYPWGTTDGRKSMHAQHTLTILSIIHSSILSLLFAIRLIGSIILSIVRYCNIHVIHLILIKIQQLWYFRLPFLNYGVFTLACTILALSMQVKPQSANITLAGSWLEPWAFDCKNTC